MRRRLGVTVGLCALALSFPPRAGLQTQQPPPPVFRGGVTLVNVDVYPRRDGKVVEGLKPEDFQVFEDGKPQKVETFEFIRIEQMPIDSDRRDPNTKEEGDELAADPHNRVFVVYLDLYHTTFAGAHDARRPLLDFLNRVIGAHDLFSVLTPEVPVRQMVFARQTDTLAAEMMKYFDWGLEDQGVIPRTPEEEILYACIDGPALIRLHREDAFMSSLEELMVRLSVLRDERKNLILISEGWHSPRARPMQMQGGPTPPQIPKIGMTPSGRLGDASIVNGTSGTTCDRAAARLSGIDFDQRFRDLLTSAQRANVAFYPVDVGGLKTFAPTASMRGVPGAPGGPPSMERLRATGQARIDTLKTLAENTDGRAIVNTNGLDQGFRRIADDLSAYYLLGYSSTNQALDGKYRRIEVKVVQPKISVAARHGYLAPSPAAMAASAAVDATKAVPSPIAEEMARLSRLRRDAELFGYVSRSATAASVVVEISAALAGRWAQGGEVRVTIPRADGDPLVASGRIEPGARATTIAVPVPAGAALSGGKIVVTSPAGVLDAAIEIPPALDSLVSNPICYRGTAAPRIPLRPVADFEFRRTERLHVEWTLLKPLDQRTVRLLDRKGQPLALDVTVTESPSAQTSAPVVAADLMLAPLAEGDYVMELTAGAGEKTERRLIAFRVVR